MMASNAPEGWSELQLGNVGESIIGLTYSPSNVKRYGTLVLRSSNIQYGRLSFDDNVYVDSPIPDRIRVRDGDVLICVRNGSRQLIGKSVRLDQRVEGQTFGAFMAVYRSGLNRFLQYFFQSTDFRRQIDGHLGATINQITNGSLNSFRIVVPNDPAEREAIAEALDDVAALVETLERLIAKKQAVRKGMVQELLNRHTRLPGFSAEWTEANLGSLGTFLKGRGIKRDDVMPGGIRCIRYGELYTAFDDYTTDTQSFVTASVASTALPLRSGDVLFAGSGETREEIGKCVAYVGPTPAVTGGDVIVLRSEMCNPIYLAVLANTPEIVAQKARAGQGDAVVHIYGQSLAAVRVPLPPREEQDAIARVIVDIDEQVCSMQRRLAKAQNTKIGMMQELLTGRTRLSKAEGAA